MPELTLKKYELLERFESYFPWHKDKEAKFPVLSQASDIKIKGLKFLSSAMQCSADSNLQRTKNSMALNIPTILTVPAISTGVILFDKSFYTLHEAGRLFERAWGQ